MSSDMESKEEAEKNSEQLNLKVLGQDGQAVQFKIKRSTPFRKLINAYCDRCRLTSNTLRFMFDGNRISETATPKSMDMEEGDTIEVFTMQTGGDDLANINGENQNNCYNSIKFKPHCYDFRISKSHMQQIQSKASLLKRKKVEIWYPS